jgi:hypothetical protein
MHLQKDRIQGVYLLNLCKVLNNDFGSTGSADQEKAGLKCYNHTTRAPGEGSPSAIACLPQKFIL